MAIKRIATHSGGFHADDSFAVAMLDIVHGGEIDVVRTRDAAVIESADIVVDVGRVYDPQKKRFDHHQEGGAGSRANGVPYASAGLVWKEYGAEICFNNIDISAIIDARLIAPIDAHDVGYSDIDYSKSHTKPYTVSNIISSFNPTWQESSTYDAGFVEAVALAKAVLLREIAFAKAEFDARQAVQAAYTSATDKRVIVLEDKLPWESVLTAHPEPLFVVYPYPTSGGYAIKAVPRGGDFEYKVRFPENWRGKEGAALEAVTGVPGSVFCHITGFATYAKDLEASKLLVKKAIGE